VLASRDVRADERRRHRSERSSAKEREDMFLKAEGDGPERPLVIEAVVQEQTLGRGLEGERLRYRCRRRLTHDRRDWGGRFVRAQDLLGLIPCVPGADIVRASAGTVADPPGALRLPPNRVGGRFARPPRSCRVQPAGANVAHPHISPVESANDGLTLSIRAVSRGGATGRRSAAR
jgi:hypothetical protein